MLRVWSVTARGSQDLFQKITKGKTKPFSL